MPRWDDAIREGFARAARELRLWLDEDGYRRVETWEEQQARSAARLAANRLEGDTHQAWALTDPAYRGRLHVVHDLEGGAPPAVASFRVAV
jgi:hypothetical protein